VETPEARRHGGVTADTGAPRAGSRRVTVRCPLCGKLNRVDLARVADRPTCGACRRPILLDRPVTVGEAELDRVLGDAEVPVLMDVYADWCGPCKTMAPVLDELARDRTGQLLVTKLDSDRNPSAASRFGVRGIPTLIVFRNGREVARETGALGRAQLDRLVERASG
jgi:thioredoxin 2